MVEPKPEEKLELEDGSAEVTLQDVYLMFYILLKQNQRLHQGGKISFDLRAFKNLPKEIKVNFQQKHGRLFAWVPETPKDQKKKSNLHLPDHRIVTPN